VGAVGAKNNIPHMNTPKCRSASKQITPRTDKNQPASQLGTCKRQSGTCLKSEVRAIATDIFRHYRYILKHSSAHTEAILCLNAASQSASQGSREQ
jgi:hypothetical protein